MVLEVSEMKKTSVVVSLIILALMIMLIPETAMCSSNSNGESDIVVMTELALTRQTIQFEATAAEPMETASDPTIAPDVEPTSSPATILDVEDSQEAYAETTDLESTSGEPLHEEADGDELIDDSEQPDHYRFWVRKRQNDANGETVSGATYRLYSADGSVVSSGTTNDDGLICFETNPSAGIVLFPHTPYYVQEAEAPTGFALNKERIWLVFCFEESESCEICDSVISTIPDELNISQPRWKRVRVSAESQSLIEVYDSMLTYVLPSTGGTGIRWYVIGGIALILSGGILMRKRR